MYTRGGGGCTAGGLENIPPPLPRLRLPYGQRRTGGGGRMSLLPGSHTCKDMQTRIPESPSLCLAHFRLVTPKVHLSMGMVASVKSFGDFIMERFAMHCMHWADHALSDADASPSDSEFVALIREAMAASIRITKARSYKITFEVLEEIVHRHCCKQHTNDQHCELDHYKEMSHLKTRASLASGSTFGNGLGSNSAGRSSWSAIGVAPCNNTMFRGNWLSRQRVYVLSSMRSQDSTDGDIPILQSDIMRKV